MGQSRPRRGKAAQPYEQDGQSQRCARTARAGAYVRAQRTDSLIHYAGYPTHSLRGIPNRLAGAARLERQPGEYRGVRAGWITWGSGAQGSAWKARTHQRAGGWYLGGRGVEGGWMGGGKGGAGDSWTGTWCLWCLWVRRPCCSSGDDMLFVYVRKRACMCVCMCVCARVCARVCVCAGPFRAERGMASGQARGAEARGCAWARNRGRDVAAA